MNNPRHPIAMRIPEDVLAQIDKRARRVGLSRTEFMIRCSLGEADKLSPDVRLDDLEARFDRLERLVSLGA